MLGKKNEWRAGNRMELYHTETQEDFNALLEKLENDGRESALINATDRFRHWEYYKQDTVIFVEERMMFYTSIRYCKQNYPEIEIKKYKAKKSMDEISHVPGGFSDYDNAVKIAKAIAKSGTSVKNINSDKINNPAHYTSGGIETLDYIKAKVKDYPSYAAGNILKYVSRYEHKNGIEDLKKAQFYLNDLIEWIECDKDV